MKFVDLDAQHERIRPRVDAALARVLAHKQFIMGPEVAALESELAEYCGCKHVLGAASGTDALLMALMAHGVGPGDGVIVPAFTFVATAEVVKLLGATAVFVDVDETTFNMDPSQLEQAIEQVRRSGGVTLKGIIPVDLFGLPAELARIREVASRHGLFMLCDAAQSFGADIAGKKTGSFGDITATSFFPAKPLGCYGDGGAVFTDSDELAQLVESIRFHGKGASQYENVRIGVTGRLDTLQAAVLSCKLEIFDDELEQRRRIADYYARHLGDDVVAPMIPDGYSSSWAVYTIRTEKRDRVRDHLQSQKIPCAVYYPMPLHRQPAFSDALMDGEMAVSERLCREVLSLPIHPYLTTDEQDLVIREIQTALG